jgi:hypothetical protein
MIKSVAVTVVAATVRMNDPDEAVAVKVWMTAAEVAADGTPEKTVVFAVRPTNEVNP